MTEKVKAMYDLIRSCEYRKRRVDNGEYDLTNIYNEHPLDYESYMLCDMLSREEPNILDGDIFGFNRHNVNTPYYFKNDRKVLAGDGNITPNYKRVIECGFDSILADIEKYEKINTSGNSKLFYQAMRRNINAVLEISERYRKHAEALGNERLANALKQVPRKPATSFYEACLFFKIIVYSLRCANQSHITIGRFDQYMYSYFKADIECGVSREELFETLEFFFLTINADSDIYYGVQQGDNGQSIVLGGFDKHGNDCYNELSEMCINASLEINMIDPKINIRVSKKTPDRIYELGTKLTKLGLGFPQYCNDDVVVPYLLSLGYAEDDAYNYGVAACWEFIVPNNAFDIPNKANYNLPLVVNEAIEEKLCASDSFGEFFDAVKEKSIAHANAYIKKYADREESKHMQFLSVFVDGCIEKGLDITEGGAKYHNFGSLVSGISTAVDSLAAIKKCVFDEKSIVPEDLIAALKANFEGYSELRAKLQASPKMGNNDDYVDSIAAELIQTYSEAFHGKDTRHGGVWRIGTGSAQGYWWQSRDTEATADGRLAGEYYACSFSPSLTAKTKGPLSTIQSFTKYDLSKVCHGGPLTMELHDSVFRNEEGEKKVAQLVKAFVNLGGHQLQLNAINRDRLLAAKDHPESYRELIVRVWGWSGYFCELDTAYQDHIIRRTEYTF